MSNFNLFNFNYETETIPNQDGSASRFSVVYGNNGNVIHAKKQSYELITTQALSNLGNAFKEKDYEVKSFYHKNGEVIGLNINLGQQLSKIGEKAYRAYITVPNNGGGCGYLSIKEVRLICTNGLVRTINSVKKAIKIPHNLSYLQSLDLMEKALFEFINFLEIIKEQDSSMDRMKIEHTDALKKLNHWFYEYEMPLNHRAQITFNDFRRMLIEEPSEIKCIDRYNSLIKCFNKELEYNSTLNLDLSVYTIFATISNYLTRRIEKSGSTAAKEIQDIRSSKKLTDYYQELIIV